MKTTVGLVAMAMVLGITTNARSDGPIPVRDVLIMMASVPSAPGDPRSRPYRWDQVPGAGPIARAIAATAPDRLWAARMAVYAVHESALSAECAVGDGKRSFGPWQLQGVARSVACDPAAAAPIWLERARHSLEDCSALPPHDRLAELTSGSCTRGRQLARLREALVLGALAKLDSIGSDGMVTGYE